MDYLCSDEQTTEDTKAEVVNCSLPCRFRATGRMYLQNRKVATELNVVCGVASYLASLHQRGEQLDRAFGMTMSRGLPRRALLVPSLDHGHWAVPRPYPGSLSTIFATP